VFVTFQKSSTVLAEKWRDFMSREAIRRDVFSKWLQKAEKRAGLPKLDGSLFHAYRRAWATARKDLPLGDVAAAGGWSDVGTLLRWYQQPDEATMLAVMSHNNKLVKQG
jgi:integrase